MYQVAPAQIPCILITAAYVQAPPPAAPVVEPDEVIGSVEGRSEAAPVVESPPLVAPAVAAEAAAAPLEEPDAAPAVVGAAEVPSAALLPPLLLPPFTGESGASIAAEVAENVADKST